jgi:hypothetical protein
MGSDILIFDGRVVRQHRERAARLAADGLFLVREVRARLVERLDDIKRRFERSRARVRASRPSPMSATPVRCCSAPGWPCRWSTATS